MASRSTVRRLGAAILGAGLVLMSALPAAAADKPKVEPHRDANEPGMGVYLERKGDLLDGDKERDGKQAFSASLIGLKITTSDETKTAKAYCVELPTPLEDGKELEEVPWDEHPNRSFKEKAGKINWILHNSYPKLSREDANKLYGTGEVKDSILIVAAQAAIWHFSDDVDLRQGDSTSESHEEGGKTVDDWVYTIYKYLIDNAKSLEEPKPSLSIDPGTLKGKAGEKIGPFTVSTTAAEAVLTAELPEGVTIVDADGNPLPVAEPDAMGVASATNVAQVWVKVAETVEPGEVEFTVDAMGSLRIGRLFVSVDKNQATQSLVIAEAQESPLTAKATAKWDAFVAPTTPSESSTTPTTTTTTTTAPTTTTTTAVAGGGGNDDDLANTGASIFVPLLIGLGLLGAGAGALLFVRRKRTA